ncbi:class I SAM-dependent methyltransferase [Endozoicomonas sp. SESOKO1]|uniref:class I SAM-dependent methyltransferase n=1 Tax=Endozoicomonas sp. SESOKO1 TaxID=2828742 RepID=UPI0021473AB9|nr:class I SAM-dependent methyltransferase [Endozoicomonas sp. SESOKO1]
MTSLPLSPHLSNPGQLIVRNQALFEFEHLVVVGLPADDLASHLLSDGIGYITALTRDFSAYQRLLPHKARLEDRFSLSFAPILPTEFAHPVEGVLLFLQKSKPLMDFWLEMVLSFLPEGAPIWLVGENDEGIKSWKKRLKNSFGHVKSIDNARHCVLLEASEPLKKPDNFNLESWFESFSVTVGPVNMDITSLPGVFSQGRLDKGTRVLLETLDVVPSGKVLDFGCGAGVISAYIDALPGEHDFTLVDCDALALASSNKTMSTMGSESFTVLPSDGLSGVSGQFDLIISNPPFHQGVKTHYEVTELFLAQSRQMLRPGGELRIVANSFLRYPPIIQKAFGHCETLLSKDGFSVYRARH